MIIGGRNEQYSLNDFIEGINIASKSFLFIQRLDRATSTGWLITDSLVVVPAYAAGSFNQLSARFSFSLEERLALNRVNKPEIARDDFDDRYPVLFRLPQSLGKPAKLSDFEPEVGERIFILHHGGGRPGPSFSIGRVKSLSKPFFSYDADTENGSSGGPVFNAYWELIGYHTHSMNSDKGVINGGVLLSKVLEELRNWEVWDEIAQFHGFADYKSIKKGITKSVVQPETKDKELDIIKAAVLWSFDKNELSEKQLKALTPLVGNPRADLWVLRSSERQRIIQSVGDLTTLQAARGSEEYEDQRQQVIDTILAGPPYDIQSAPVETLPYWLQAVRWFSPTIEGLPSPKEINQLLQQKRFTNQLQEISGDDFLGRQDELSLLLNWYNQADTGPMVVTGIGGVGKSALVAFFLQKLDLKTIILWLDFDRADLAPDDVFSVLSVLYEYLKIYINGISPPEMDENEDWEAIANHFGASLVENSDPAHPPIMILDGFEVAQYAKRHGEIWSLLEVILKKIPNLKILVSGRAPVMGLVLGERNAQNLDLQGLPDPVSVKFMKSKKVRDSDFIEKTTDAANGVPLILKLAVQYYHVKGKDHDVENLPRKLIEGFLYQRILDRVLDPELKPLIRSAIVVRRVLFDMIEPVFGDDIPEGMSVNEVFERLENELSLVSKEATNAGLTLVSSSTGVLQLRPEVRSATLKLLEEEDKAHVSTVDQKVVDWYKTQDLDLEINRAELIFHLLRLGELDEVKSLWRPGCAKYLSMAMDDLSEEATAARNWLEEKLNLAKEKENSIQAWEEEVAQRIRHFFTRNANFDISTILAEREERTENGPLVFYDAWLAWNKGDLDNAANLLEKGRKNDGITARNCIALSALVLSQKGQKAEAFKLLRKIEALDIWEDWGEDAIDAMMAVKAARIHLTVDLQSEMGLIQKSEYKDFISELGRFLLPIDTVITELARQLVGSRDVKFEASSSIIVNEDPPNSLEIARKIDDAREAGLDAGGFFLPLTVNQQPNVEFDVNTFSVDEIDIDLFWSPDEIVEDNPNNGPEYPAKFREYFEDAFKLSILGWKRWWVASLSEFLCNMERFLNRNSIEDPLKVSILGVLGLFQYTPYRPLEFYFGKLRINELIEDHLFEGDRMNFLVSETQLSFFREIFNLRAKLDPDAKKWLELVDRDQPNEEEFLTDSIPIEISVRRFVKSDPEIMTSALFLLATDPLYILVQRIAGAMNKYDNRGPRRKRFKK